MRPLQLLNLVVMRLCQLRNARTAVAAQALHLVNHVAEIPKQVRFFLQRVSVRRVPNRTATATIPLALTPRRETSLPFLVLTFLLSFVVGGMCLVQSLRAECVGGRRERSRVAAPQGSTFHFHRGVSGC
jgi:hypothetical protein